MRSLASFATSDAQLTQHVTACLRRLVADIDDEDAVAYVKAKGGARSGILLITEESQLLVQQMAQTRIRAFAK